jgi:uncharacterized protein (TIGR00255 family)
MIFSMTGYGKSNLQKNDFLVEVEIKSLNSRFLDIFPKLPKSLYDKELEIRNLIKNKVRRGKISVSVYVERNVLDNRIANIQDDKLEAVLNLLNDLRKKSNIQAEISLQDLLGFQNIFFSDESDENEEEYKIAVEAINEALEQLNKMRRDEGEALANELRERIENITGSLKKIEQFSRNEVVEYFDKLKKRAKDLVRELPHNDDRLQMELALLAEKYDITEECVRLRSHVSQFVDTLKNSDDVGRRLNFLSQEMNREANTINSKSVSTDITNEGIAIKQELEKIREQIQNIE